MIHLNLAVSRAQIAAITGPGLTPALSALLGLFPTLTPREAQVLTLRFGLDNGDEYTLQQCGTLLELSSKSIRHIEEQALNKLRQPRYQPALRGLFFVRRFRLLSADTAPEDD